MLKGHVCTWQMREPNTENGQRSKHRESRLRLGGRTSSIGEQGVVTKHIARENMTEKMSGKTVDAQEVGTSAQMTASHPEGRPWLPPSQPRDMPLAPTGW